MKTLDELKNNIKEISRGVPGIGNVYDRFLYAFDSKQVKDYFSFEGNINTLMFRFFERTALRGEGISDEQGAKRLWQFRFIYGYNYDKDSEHNFDNVCEEICKAFNSGSALNTTARSTFMNITDKYDSEYHGILVHNAELEMETN